MLRSVFAVVVGFILWSALWLVYNLSLRKLDILPADVSQPLTDTKSLLLLLVGSAVMSVLAGYATAFIARSGSSTVIAALGLVLLAVGLFFQSQVWHLMPLWYHCSFLLLLLPLCFVGKWLCSVR